MSKSNGWNGSAVRTEMHGSRSNSSTSFNSPSALPKYSRSTELRRVEDNDIYRLSMILDENACWRKLMSVIPKGLDVQASSGVGGLNFSSAVKKGFKYTTQDVRQIDEAANRLPPDHSKSQMMIDEWKTSGKLHERPTVGVLLQLLVQAELFSAADFVALDFLNEPKPDRPTDGPAAPISLDLSELLDEDMDVDHEGVVTGSVGLNLDNFDKDMMQREKMLPQMSQNVAALAPPYSLRLQREPLSSNNSVVVSTETASTTTNTAPNIPNLTILNSSEQIADQDQQRPPNIPNLSILMASSVETTTVSTSLGSINIQTNSSDAPNIPQITLLIDNSTAIGSPPLDASTAMGLNNLPMISALNLNTDNCESTNLDTCSSSSLSNNDDGDAEYAEASLPNLSNSENFNSNNDSSLTTVTGTSGDNSFELTNDSSSTSNDEYGGNIPNLSELQP
ncbi:hypothetical protein KR018_002293 [Drosophila ironensis]|nr:hypothetical protein KR018_002293 [Drosophila ironensis]